VVSPNDKADEVDKKIEMLLKVGVLLIWIVNPDVRTVRVIRGDGSAAILREPDQLSGEDIIPGFTCPVASIFPPKAPDPASEPAPRV
jgi:Uma2 family endonuclease